MDSKEKEKDIIPVCSTSGASGASGPSPQAPSCGAKKGERVLVNTQDRGNNAGKYRKKWGTLMECARQA